jgi:hypothetical protein
MASIGAVSQNPGLTAPFVPRCGHQSTGQSCQTRASPDLRTSSGGAHARQAVWNPQRKGNCQACSVVPAGPSSGTSSAGALLAENCANSRREPDDCSQGLSGPNGRPTAIAKTLLAGFWQVLQRTSRRTGALSCSRAERVLVRIRQLMLRQLSLVGRKGIVLALLAATARLKPERLASPTVARR